MNDTPETDKPEESPKPTKKPGLLARLFQTVATSSQLSIAIAPFIDPTKHDHARNLEQVFKGLNGVFATTFRSPSLLSSPDAAEDRQAQLPAAVAQAMGWVAQQKADLVLWGDIPAPGTTLHIFFASAPPVDEDPAGITSPFQALTLPVNFDPDALGGLLIAASLAAIHVSSKPKRQAQLSLVASALERAAQDVERLPNDFTMREIAAVQAAYANALATFGHLFPGDEVLNRAVAAYTEALKGTLRSDNPANWAYLQRNLGTVLQILGERSNNLETLEHAINAYRAALEVFTKDTTPFPWATTQNRLGEVLYRLDIKSDAMDGLKESLNLYQTSLKVLNHNSTPLLWSETLSNLSQAAQILGRQLSNVQLLERAVWAIDQALKVRDRNLHPTLWAASQNNMGSALFLLGRMADQPQHFEPALGAFMNAREVYETLGLTKMVEHTDRNIQHAQARLPDPDSLSQKGNANDPDMWWLDDD